MLKDLDERQVEQQGSGNMAVPVSPSSSNKKTIFISILVIIIINVVGLFVWQMYVENQALKKANIPEIKYAEQKVVKNKVAKVESTEPKTATSQLAITPIVHDKLVTSKSENDTLTSGQSETVSNIVLSPTMADDFVTDQSNKTSQQTRSSDVNIIESDDEDQAPIKKSSLKISRKQLSPRELAQQKVKRAEQALANKDIAKAEHLFEDVLLVLPEHKSARKQLAALWFGRKSFAPALNLLSQGIALSPEDSEFRVMQARIYLQHNRVDNAFSVLNNIARVNSIMDVEYQSLRATTAQQLNEYSFATEAYQVLVEIEPSVGRWWLGLGVALDSSSEFKKASTAYITALSKTGLSDSAENFARQRIIELGE